MHIYNCQYLVNIFSDLPIVKRPLYEKSYSSLCEIHHTWKKSTGKKLSGKKYACKQLESVKSIFLQMKIIEVTVRISQEYIHPNEKH